MTATKQNLISSSAIEHRIFASYGAQGRYVQTLFDPVQTHALYGLTKEDLREFKDKLKEMGASRFRTVSTRFGFKILCFNASKIK